MRRQKTIQKFSWLFPRLKKIGLYSIAFAFFLSNFSCESPKQTFLIDKEDREVVDDFLRYMAISELGIYTVLGSKPVTEFHIPQIQPEDELRARYDVLPKNFRKKVSFEKFNTNTQIEELLQICSKWIQIQHKYIGEHFTIHFDEELHSGVLVNLPLAIYILKEHYQAFSKVLGTDFDPLVVSREIGKSSSSSWKAIKSKGNSYLMGLLFGFGEKNSKFFQWETEKRISFPFRAASYNPPWLKKRAFSRYVIGEKIKNLGIPQFVIYQPIDEVVERYLVEKERIMQIYKGEDFAETTVSFLKGESVCQLLKRKK